MRKKSKVIGLLIVLTLIITITVSAYILSHYVQLQADINVEGMFTWDDTSAEDLYVDEDFNISGNETVGYNHWLNYSSDAGGGDITVFFNWSGNDTADGITPSIEIGGNTVTQYTLSPSDNVMVNTSYYANPYIKTDAYQCILTVEYQP